MKDKMTSKTWIALFGLFLQWFSTRSSWYFWLGWKVGSGHEILWLSFAYYGTLTKRAHVFERPRRKATRNQGPTKKWYWRFWCISHYRMISMIQHGSPHISTTSYQQFITNEGTTNTRDHRGPLPKAASFCELTRLEAKSTYRHRETPDCQV